MRESKINKDGSVYLKGVLFSKKQNEILGSMLVVAFFLGLIIGLIF